MNNNEVEKGKAIIQLAQITIIISGFLFTIGGITYTNSINVLSTSLPLITNQGVELIKIDESNFTTEKKRFIEDMVNINQEYLNTVKPQLDLTMWSFSIGLIGLLLSNIFWIWGYNKIKKSKTTV